MPGFVSAMPLSFVPQLLFSAAVEFTAPSKGAPPHATSSLAHHASMYLEIANARSICVCEFSTAPPTALRAGRDGNSPRRRFRPSLASD